MLHTRVSRTIVALLAILSVLLAACQPAPAAPPTATSVAQQTGTGGGTTPAAASTPAAAATPAATGGATATPTQAQSQPTATTASGSSQSGQLDKDQTIRMLGSEPTTADPQMASYVDDVNVVMRVFESLMTFNEKAEVVPAAAEGYTVSSDGKTYTFKIRKGLKYSDGQPLTAKNFEYAWKRLLDPKLAAQYASIAYDIAGAEQYNTADPRSPDLQKLRDALGIKALDDETLEFKLTQPAAYFPDIAALWVGAPTREDIVQKYGEDKWATEADSYIGNGPFVLKVWDHQSRMRFEPNPNYRMGKAPAAQELLYIADPAVALAAYQNGEIDAVGIGATNLKAVQTDPVLSKEIRRSPGTCTFYMGFNTTKAPFDNVKVRQAFAQAIDREGYVANINKGIGQPAYSFIPPGIPGYDASIKTWKFDPAAAKKLLADAGYPDGKGLPEIKITYSSGAAAKTQFEWFQAQFKDNLNIDVKLDPVEGGTYAQLLSKPSTTPQVWSLGWCMDYPDPQDWLTLVFNSKSNLQYTQWKNADFDKLTRQADQERDQSKRLQLYAQAQKILVDEAPVIFLDYDENVSLLKPYIQNYKGGPAAQYFGQFDIMNLKVGKRP